MNNNEIIENNKLIAEFMGVLPNNGGEYEMYQLFDFLEDKPASKHFFFTSEMLFNSSWDWLMPVFKKLDSIVWDMESKGNDNQDHAYQLQEALLSLDLTDIYTKSVEAIKWFNTQSK